jgi:hypothetical protein
MCWADVQISQQQSIRGTINSTGAGPRNLFVPADPERVRLIYSIIANTLNPANFTQIFAAATDQSGRDPLVVFRHDEPMPVILDIAVYGEIVRGPLLFSIGDSEGNIVRAVIVPVILSDPLNLGRPYTSLPASTGKKG